MVILGPVIYYIQLVLPVLDWHPNTPSCNLFLHSLSARVPGTITDELLLMVVGCEAGVISRPWMQWAGLQEPQLSLRHKLRAKALVALTDGFRINPGLRKTGYMNDHSSTLVVYQPCRSRGILGAFVYLLMRLAVSFLALCHRMTSKQRSIGDTQTCRSLEIAT